MNPSRKTAVMKRTSINNINTNKQEEIRTLYSLLSNFETSFYAKECTL